MRLCAATRLSLSKRHTADPGGAPSGPLSEADPGLSCRLSAARGTDRSSRVPNQLCPGCHLRTASQTRPGSPQPTAVTVFLRVPYYGIWPVPQQTQIHLSCTWGSDGREKYVPHESQNTEFTKYLTSGYKKKKVSENGYNSECSFSYLVEIRRSLFTIPAVKIPDTLKQVKS